MLNEQLRRQGIAQNYEDAFKFDHENIDWQKLEESYKIQGLTNMREMHVKFNEGECPCTHEHTEEHKKEKEKVKPRLKKI